MGRNLEKWKAFGPLFTVLWSFLLASIFVSAERSLKQESLSRNATRDSDSDLLSTFVNFIWQANKSGYHHVWPDLKFNWQIVVGSIIGFFGAAFGSVGGVGGGGIFVPMLSLIIGFDPKSATAISKCMIMGAAVSTEAAKRLETNGDGKEEAEYKLLPGGPSNNTEKEAKDLEEPEVSIIENVCWKEFGLLIFVWIAFLAVQIIKEYTTTCSTSYWVVNLLQVPVSFGVSGYEAVSLYKGWRKIGSKGDEGTNFKVHQLLTYGLFGVLAGMVGGLLGLGGGFIMGPLFLELGVPPQVSSATATFAMMFSSSMSVVEYYLLKRFPIPYALYFVAVATVAAFIGQHVVRKLIIVLGRASIIIFILSFTIFVSAISLGGVGISNMVGKIQRHEYMGFENLCKYEV
ncbi:UNVERIFIED_CONTAM: Sulfite exporter TauE/SafE family protein 3 [Sesamum calycinum]|uniref:Sulfite exporter TauE/SafE family protein 3 n=1 Tax=Sesamum calycinum TaxID=2727403 RepID=A0AAW2LX99_9LAMI